MSALFHYFSAVVTDGDVASDWLWHLPVWAQPMILHAGDALNNLIR